MLLTPGPARIQNTAQGARALWARLLSAITLAALARAAAG